jgi:hypothetical protein
MGFFHGGYRIRGQEKVFSAYFKSRPEQIKAISAHEETHLSVFTSKANRFLEDWERYAMQSLCADNLEQVFGMMWKESPPFPMHFLIGSVITLMMMEMYITAKNGSKSFRYMLLGTSFCVWRPVICRFSLCIPA